MKTAVLGDLHLTDNFGSVKLPVLEWALRTSRELECDCIHQSQLLMLVGNVQNVVHKCKANSAQNVAPRNQKKDTSSAINVVGNQKIQITFQSSAQNAVIQSTKKTINNNLWPIYNLNAPAVGAHYSSTIKRN